MHLMVWAKSFFNGKWLRGTSKCEVFGPFHRIRQKLGQN